MLATSNGGTTWDTEYTRTAQQLNAVYYSSDTTGWAVGNTGVVMRTTDGADSWSVQQVGTANLLAVHFADANTGWAVGSAGRIIKTADGGNTWVAQTSDREQRPQRRVVHLANDRRGRGRSGDDPANDKRRQPRGAQSHRGRTGRCADVQFSGPSVGWAVGNNGTILQSTDGGATWTAQTSGTNQRLNSVSCVSTQVALRRRRQRNRAAGPSTAEPRGPP